MGLFDKLKKRNDKAANTPDNDPQFKNRESYGDRRNGSNKNYHPPYRYERKLTVFLLAEAKEDMKRKRILYLTDLGYQAKGRIYSEEDIYITDRMAIR